MKTLRIQNVSQKDISLFFGLLLTSMTGSFLLGQSEHSLASPWGLELQWSDHYGLLEAKIPSWDRREIWSEIESIFEDTGIPLQWNQGAANDGLINGTVSVRIILVPKSGEGWGLPSKAMGVVMGRQTLTRNLYVFFPAFLEALGEKGSSRKFIQDPREARTFARALARVIAHEVVHAVDPSIPHRRNSGILSANLSKNMLRQEDLSFASDTIQKLLVSLRPVQMEMDEVAVVAASSNPE